MESQEAGAVIGPIAQEGKLRPGELEEVAQDRRARQGQSQEESTDLPDSSDVLPIGDTA